MTYIHNHRPPVNDELRLSEISRMAIRYRTEVGKGMTGPQMHNKLNDEEFADGSRLPNAVIAGIVNYSFYPADTNTLRRIMGHGRI